MLNYWFTVSWQSLIFPMPMLTIQEVPPSGWTPCHVKSNLNLLHLSGTG